MEKNSEVANEVTDAQRRTMLWSKQKPEIKLEPRAYDVNNNIQIFPVETIEPALHSRDQFHPHNLDPTRSQAERCWCPLRHALGLAQLR